MYYYRLCFTAIQIDASLVDQLDSYCDRRQSSKGVRTQVCDNIIRITLQVETVVGWMVYSKSYLSHLGHIDDHMFHTRWQQRGSNPGSLDS